MKMCALFLSVALAAGFGASLCAADALTVTAPSAPDATASNLVGKGKLGKAGKADKTDKADRKADREAAMEKKADRQEKRIDKGVKKGQITPDELALLKPLEATLKTVIAALPTAGKPAKGQGNEARTDLKNASLQIWAHQHDSAGNQAPERRLGKNVFAQDSLTGAIESGSTLTTDDRQFQKDLHAIVQIKRELSSGSTPAGDRTALQGQYDKLFSKYFVQK